MMRTTSKQLEQVAQQLEQVNQQVTKSPVSFDG